MTFVFIPLLGHFPINDQVNTQNMQACYTVDKPITLFLEEDEKEKYGRTGRTNFRLVYSFWTWLTVIRGSFIQSNKTSFIDFLFCRVDEADPRRMNNEKVATFCNLAKKAWWQKIQAE